MKQDERYVMECLVDHFGGDFSNGEDPPDGYLIINDQKIAVEVSRLVQQVQVKNGNLISRFAQDKPPLMIIKALNEELYRQIPENKYVFVVLKAPIIDLRKTKKD